MTSYSSGRSSTCCRKLSAITSLTTMSVPVSGFLNGSHGPAPIGCGAELLLRQLVAPVAERALGELHDVALVHERHRDAIVLDGVLDRLADQALAALLRYRLDADAGAGGEADAA